MIKEYCDMCGKNIKETFEDILDSCTYMIQDTNSKCKIPDNLTLCSSCKETLYYLMNNPCVLRKHVKDMSFINRIRFLFKKDIFQNIEVIDNPKIIHCMNCKHYGRSPFGHPTIGWCMIAGNHRKPDYYCADGKERD